MSLAATMTIFDLHKLLSWWNNWKQLVNPAAQCFSSIRLRYSSLRSTAATLPLLFSRAYFFHGFIISSLGHKIAAPLSDPPAPPIHFFSYCHKLN